MSTPRSSSTDSALRRGALAIAVLLAGSALLLITWRIERPVVAQETLSAYTTPAADVPRFEGVASCSASACHGGGRPLPGGRIWGNEYSIWATRDPHHRAYRVLFEPRSQRILENLYGQSNFAALSQGQQQNCLACHSTAATAAETFRDMLLADGVSCESCHGPAGDWLGPHTVATWSGRRPEFIDRGMLYDTKDLHTRVAQCVRCHVGGPGHDVNHDLIAAGHPRMLFEFSAYLDRLPKHWTERDTSVDFDARAWALGQFATASQALELLASRADRAQQRLAASPNLQHPLLWPEFSEYGCYACHHELGAALSAPSRPFHAKPGELPWGTWYYSLLRQLTAPEHHAGLPLDGPAWHDSISLLDQSMRQLTPQAQAFTTVEAEIPRAVAQLQSAADDLRHRRISSTEAVVWMLDIAAIGTQAADWDEAVQCLLALSALQAAIDRDTLREQVAHQLAELRQALRFPEQYDSPLDYDPGAIRARFERLHTHLAHAVEDDRDA